MRLYHGTSSRHLESILRDGLKPRGEGPSNWEAASSNQVVYLTRTYGLHFASNARTTSDEDLAIVEIDTDLLPNPESLLADEDAICFAWQKGHLPRFSDEGWLRRQTLQQQAMYFAELLQEYSRRGFTASWSLNVLGNCTHKGVIPPEAITRVVTYEGKIAWWLFFHDPVISPLNYGFCGPEYEATQLIVAGRPDEAAQVEQVFPMNFREVEDICAKRRNIVFDREPAEQLAVGT